jgi:hypothetical protein
LTLDYSKTKRFYDIINFDERREARETVVHMDSGPATSPRANAMTGPLSVISF